MIYQYAPAETNDPTLADVTHVCGHKFRYRYGGPADVFREPRAAFAHRERDRSCPTCRMAARLYVTVELGQIDLPVKSARFGAGRLTTATASVCPDFPDRAILLLDDPVLIERTDANARTPSHQYGVPYRFAAKAIGPSPEEASLLERSPSHKYHRAELEWVDLYVIESAVADVEAEAFNSLLAGRMPDHYARRYPFGLSFRSPAQLREVTRRLSGRPAPTSSTRTWSDDPRPA